MEKAAVRPKVPGVRITVAYALQLILTMVAATTATPAFNFLVWPEVAVNLNAVGRPSRPSSV